jgi:YidC/Oxa1 family membrane protein insertase
VHVNYKLKDMEEKKLDINSIIGFLLIGAILLYMLWQNQPTPEQLAEQEKAKQEQLATESANQAAAEMAITDNSNNNQLPTDSLGLASLKNQIGDFAYALTLPSATTNVTTFENEVLALKIDNKGGFISEVRLKSYVNHDSVPVYLIKDGSSVFNLNFATSDNRTLNSTNLYFQPTLSTSGDNQVLSMRLNF